MPRPVGRSPEEQTQWERATRIARELSGHREPARSVVNAMYALVQADEKNYVPTIDLEAERRAETLAKVKRTAKASAREVLPRRGTQLDMFSEMSA